MYSIKKMRIGYCSVCQKRTIFVSFDNWLRESYRCAFCHSSPRQRALIKVLNDNVPEWKQKRIHESSPSGAVHRMLKKYCADYTYSFFYEDKELGKTISAGCTNQNLENLKFEDNSFDIFITQDVFEHINNPFAAFKEIYRVLKPGGVHIFTVPIDSPLKRTVPRISIENGIRKPILPEVYHGNPIDKENGSLVTYDWGNDICELIEKCSGMPTSIIEFDKYADRDENAYLGLEAYSLYVLVSKKLS